MSRAHPFRFGVIASMAGTGDEWLARARRVESLGFATLVTPDVLRYSPLAPLPALAAVAAVTRSLRLGSYVLANDYRNPVMLAKEVATLDLLSGGRFELGIGAGRPAAEDDNRMLGLPFDSGRVRLARLAESLGILKALLAGKTAPPAGPYYALEHAEIGPRGVQQPHPPILLAGSGQQMLALAAREADIIGLGVPPAAIEATVAGKIALVRAAAGERFDDIELNMNLVAVGDQVPRYLSRQLGLTAASLAEAGAATIATGTPEEMCETLLGRRERLGISYFVVADELMETFAPVVERLSGR